MDNDRTDYFKIGKNVEKESYKEAIPQGFSSTAPTQ